MQDRYQYFFNIKEHVNKSILNIRNLPDKFILNAEYLENEFIPQLGLNDEMLNEMPTELSMYYGKGLHLWQYPNQLSKYLVFLALNAKQIHSYMEIGCRWGGTFILVNEWLKRCGSELDFSIAVDPIPKTPFIEQYEEISQHKIFYYQGLSTDLKFQNIYKSANPNFVFIDGDHTLVGVMNDHLLVRKFAKFIAHHDISSITCRDTSFFWDYVKLSEDNFEAFEFTQQYESVNGSYLGIGVLRRRY